ncbi:hypothetical protein D3C84_1191720 [compost metagenome]
MAIDVYGGDGLIALLNQPGLLQVVQFVADGTLGQTGVQSQGGGRWKGTGAIRAGIVG